MGLADAAASAPEQSRSWLLIEHTGPWAAEELDTAGLPPLARNAVALGIRVQLIRRPGEADGRVYAAWTAGPSVWAGEFTGDLEALAAVLPEGAPRTKDGYLIVKLPEAKERNDA